MKPRYYVIVAVFSLAVEGQLAGCAASMPIRGQTISGEPKDTLKKLRLMMQLTGKCSENPSSVTVALVDKSDDIRISPDRSRFISGWVKESWTFDACGGTPMYVTYRFQPSGETLYQLSGK